MLVKNQPIASLQNVKINFAKIHVLLCKNHTKMAKEKPLILVTNDDGITAPGLRSLIKTMKQIGDVIVVAPDSPQSGMGHAITVNSTLVYAQI